MASKIIKGRHSITINGERCGFDTDPFVDHGPDIEPGVSYSGHNYIDNNKKVIKVTYHEIEEKLQR